MLATGWRDVTAVPLSSPHNSHWKPCWEQWCLELPWIGWAPISWGPYHWHPEATDKFWWWLIISPSGLKYSLFPTRLQRHVLVLSWMRSLAVMVALMRFTTIREEIMKVGSSLSSVDCLRCARQGPHQETHDVTTTQRFNRTLISMVKAYLKGEQTNWDRNLGCLAVAHRASQHESTGLTPNLLMLGREVQLPSEVMFGSGKMISGEPITTFASMWTLHSRMQMAHVIAWKHQTSTAQRQKQDYDFKAHLKRYQTGDLVWVISPSWTSPQSLDNLMMDPTWYWNR